MQKINILLVDDSQDNLIALEAVLASLNVNIVTANSGDMALRYLLDQEFAVILLDVQMHGMSGFETAELIKKREKSRHTPIIFISGLDITSLELFKGYSVGAVDYLTKPVVPEILLTKVSTFVDLYQKNAELREQAAQIEAINTELRQQIEQIQKLDKDVETQRQVAKERKLLLDREQEARQQAEAMQHRMAFLAEASAVLASSLDYETTLTNVAQLAVPTIADWCSIHIKDEDGTVRQLAVAHKDPEKIKWAHELRQRYPPNPESRSGVYEVIRSGKSEFYPEIPDAMLEKVAVDAEQLEIIRQIGFTSSMSVPLIIHDRVLGALSLVATESKKPFTQQDLAFAEDLARHAALAVENAHLYRQSQQAMQAAERYADRTLRLQKVTAALSNVIVPEEVASAIVEQCVEALDNVYGCLVAKLTQDEQYLEILHSFGYSGSRMAEWQQIAMSQRWPITDVVRNREPFYLETQEAWNQHYPEMVKLAVSASLAMFPLMIEDRCIGALVVGFSTLQTFNPEDRSFLMAMAAQCAQALERSRLYQAEKQARAEVEAGQARTAFLAEASTLLASSLDYETTLTSVANLAVVDIADWCTVHIVENGQTPQQLTVAHRDPAKVQWAYELQRRYPPDPQADMGVNRVIRTGNTEFIPEITEAMIIAAAKDAEQLALIREVGFTAYMIVPIKARDRILGAIQFVSAESGRHYTQEDVALAQALAGRAGIAIDNALLYQETVQQRESLQVTLQSIGDAVIATDPDGCVTFMNPVAEVLTGWSQQDAEKRPLDEVFNIVNETTREIVENPVKKVLRLGTIVGLANHTILIARNGREIPIDDSGAPIRDTEGNIIGIILVFRDIEERKQAEQAQQILFEASTILASSLEYDTTLQNIARLIVASLGDHCVVDLVDDDGTIRHVALASANPQQESLLKKFASVFPVDWQNNALSVPRVLKTGEPLLFSEVSEDLLRSTAENAEQLALMHNLNMGSAMIVPMISSGRVSGTITFWAAKSGQYQADDLILAQELAHRAAPAVEHARLYREAWEATQARDEFLSVAAHELRTPITSLLGFAQTSLRKLNREGQLETSYIRHALELIEQQSSKLGVLAAQLLDISRIEAGQLRLDRQPTALGDLIQEVIKRIETITSKHTIQFDTAAPVRTAVDPLRFEQVLMNLLDNAIKYSPDGGPIDVSLAQTEDHNLRISITDHGVGIPVEHRPRIFERFFRAHDGTIQGMGLGLYISRQIVELHNGAITAEFPMEGGTRFVVTLPADAVSMS